MPPQLQPEPGILLYQTEDGRTRIQCRFEHEPIWLSQIQLAELFQTSVPNINLHLKAIYAGGELAEEATIKSYLIVRSEGVRQVTRPVPHYKLEAILAVAHRIRSHRLTHSAGGPRLSPKTYSLVFATRFTSDHLRLC